VAQFRAMRTPTIAAAVVAWSVSTVVVAQGLPSAPLNLTAQVAGSQVTLTWLSTTAEPTTFVLEAGSATGLADLASFDTGSAQTTFQSPPLPAGTYFVRVRARTTAGTSGPSNEVVVTTPAACLPPPAPTNLVATDVGSVVALNWTGVGAAFQLEAGSFAGGSDVFVGQFLSTGISTTAPLGTYWVRVRAVNSCGLSGPSNEIILAHGVPLAPTNLVASIIGATATFQWTAPHATPTPYLLEAGSAPGRRDLVALALGSGTTFVAPGIPPGTYYVRVRATAGAFAGPPSNDIAVTIGPPPAGSRTITFDSLPPNGPAFTSHSEAGYTVEAVSGPWTSGPALISKNPTPLTSVDSELKVTAIGGASFRLDSVRLYSSVTPIPYVLRGLRQGAVVYTSAATVPNTFGAFATVPNPFAGVDVDAVHIVVTNPATPSCPTCGGNPVGVDDIVVRP
jgi:predicted phage tail protein